MNRLLRAITLSALTLTFTHSAFANRPAAEDPEVIDTIDPVAEQQAPSAMENMMQRQHSGDVVTLPPQEIQPGETVQIKLLDFPRRGMSMDQVQNEYGQPAAISDSVGKPPITRWTYGDRIVYFEYSKVIHVVAR